MLERGPRVRVARWRGVSVTAALRSKRASGESMLALVLLLMACGTAPVEPPRPSGPDIVVISVDTLRHDRLGFAGHDGAHTPHLDRLAEAGRVFTQATTPFPRTTPALASLQTG